MFIIYSTLHSNPFYNFPFFRERVLWAIYCVNLFCITITRKMPVTFSRRTLKIETNRSFSRKNTFKIHEETK